MIHRRMLRPPAGSTVYKLTAMGKTLEKTLLEHGAQPNKASLRKQWQRVWSRPDGASTVGAYENGIHRVANSGRRPATSLHLYGPRTGVFDGRDYDPSRDFVCDRLELDELVPHPIIQYH